jgi:putative aminopeptidase FrvX
MTLIKRQELIDMKKMRKQFIKLLSIHGVSGDEGAVRSYLIPCLKSTMDSVHVDEYGNLLGEKKYGTGEGPTVLLSAHMDTVKGVLADRKLIESDGFIMSDKGVLGADDRAGIAIILAVLRNLNSLTSFNGIVKVAFSREEEIGCVGSTNIDKKWYEDVDLAIVVDRRGTRDIVVGCMAAFCSNAVGVFMENVADLIDQSDWKCVEGGISDAMTFSSNGINSINISAGYENEHSENEYVSLAGMRDSTMLIMQTFAVIGDFYKTFGEVPGGNKWVKEYTSYNNKHVDSKFEDDYDKEWWRNEDYSIADFLDADAVSDDGELEVYHLGNGEIMVHGAEGDVFLDRAKLE